MGLESVFLPFLLPVPLPSSLHGAALGGHCPVSPPSPWGCTQRQLCSPACFLKWWMCSFINSPVVSLTLLCTTRTGLVFTHPRRRSGNKILFSQEMVSLVYLNESAVVCCFTRRCEHPDQRINTRFQIRSISASLCLWYANKESLNIFDSIKLIRGFECRLSNHELAGDKHFDKATLKI